MADLMRVTDGFGQVSILRLIDMQNRPKLFSSFMLQMLAELYASLPEVDDPEKPKLVIFIDEAHLIFDDAEKALLDEIETVIKLIRSKGVGIFFCTQMPTDVPESVLGQLGMKVQHALRAFTAKDRKAINLVAQNYPETQFYKTEQLLTSLGIEALVTVLDERGAPTPLVATLLCAPRSRMGALTAEELQETIGRSALAGKYNSDLDPQSAYEILGGKIATAAAAVQEQPAKSAPRRTFSPSAATPRSPELDAALGSPSESASEPAGLPYPPPVAPTSASSNRSPLGEIFGSRVAQSVLRSVAVNVAGTVTRSLLGAMGVRSRRYR
jgi:hypothetical protein